MSTDKKLMQINFVENRKICIPCRFLVNYPAVTENHGEVFVEYCIRAECDNLVNDGKKIGQLDESAIRPNILSWLKKQKTKHNTEPPLLELDSIHNQKVEDNRFCLVEPMCTQVRLSASGEYICNSNLCDNHFKNIWPHREFEERSKFIEACQIYIDARSESIGFLEE